MVLDIEAVKNQWESFCRDEFFELKAYAILVFLPYDLAKPFLRDGVKEENWLPLPLDQQNVVQQMCEYMALAWGQALGHEGLIVGRSIVKMEAWLWLLEDEELLKFIKNDDNYDQYGVPILYKICQQYEFPIPNKPQVKRMAKGLPCIKGCQEGCRR